jgi:hypothetical protein
MVTPDCTGALTPGHAPLTPQPAFSADMADEMNEQLAHLSAMLEVTYGNGGEGFELLSSKTRDTYLWACARKLRDLEAAWRAIERTRLLGR